MRRSVRAVLFDLDGTLLDSAPDLAGACNDMRAERGLSALPFAQLRRLVGSGARGMVGAGFDIAPGDDGYEPLRDEFLRRYEQRMTRDTALFPEVPTLLDGLRQLGLPWGIVTNKAARFAVPLVDWLGLERTVATLVCGDTTPHSKPHPAPLLEAARQVGVPAAGCIYIGDDHRDIEAGRAAGMQTLVAAWGYLGAGSQIAEWGADGVVQTPGDVLGWIEKA